MVSIRHGVLLGFVVIRIGELAQFILHVGHVSFIPSGLKASGTYQTMQLMDKFEPRNYPAVGEHGQGASERLACVREFVGCNSDRPY